MDEPHDRKDNRQRERYGERDDVAFSATALAIALLLRLFQKAGSTTPSNDASPSVGSDPPGG
jgi:hypothetical protein